MGPLAGEARGPFRASACVQLCARCPVGVSVPPLPRPPARAVAQAQEGRDGESGGYSPVLEHGGRDDGEAVDTEQDDREQKRRRLELLAAEQIKRVCPGVLFARSFSLFPRA